MDKGKTILDAGSDGPLSIVLETFYLSWAPVIWKSTTFIDQVRCEADNQQKGTRKRLAAVRYQRANSRILTQLKGTSGEVRGVG